MLTEMFLMDGPGEVTSLIYGEESTGSWQIWQEHSGKRK